MSLLVFVERLHGLVAHIRASEQFAQFFAYRPEPPVDNGIDLGNRELIFAFQSFAFMAPQRVLHDGEHLNPKGESSRVRACTMIGAPKSMSQFHAMVCTWRRSNSWFAGDRLVKRTPIPNPSEVLSTSPFNRSLVSPSHNAISNLA